MKEGKIREHKLSDKNPILSSVLFGVIGLVIIQILMELIDLVIRMIIPAYNMSVGPVGIILSAVLILLWYKNWFKPHFLGSLKGTELYTGVWVLVIARLIYLALSAIVDFLLWHTKMIPPTLDNMFLALMAGVTEEATFRGMMLPVLMRKYKGKNFMMPIMTCAITFGLFHGVNLLAGADPGSTVLQVVASFLSGIAFTALYLVSGNILVPMALHFIHDVLALCYEGVEEGIVVSKVTASSFTDPALGLILAIFVMYYINRPEVRERILSIWKKKWSEETINEEN